MAFRKALLAAAAAAVPSLAQQPIYAQCGGIGWTGGTTCTAGNFCSQLNAYYFQCLPGAGSTTVASTTPVSTPVSKTTSVPTTISTVTGTAPTGTAVAGNPFAGKQIYANPYYSSEIHTLAIPSLTGTLATKATAVAEVGTFVWLDQAAKVPTMDTYLTNIEALNAAGASPEVIGAFVVYDLPDRDCAAAASNGEYTIADGGVADYFAYIDSITAIVKKHSSTSIVFVIEPDSLANLVTNLSVEKCAEAEAAYLQCVTYAIQQLNLPNVSMYLDAGHAGWLGWSANIGPAATLFSSLWSSAGSPQQVRGLATNVANYNAWTGACASYTSGDSNCNEELYVNNLAPLLTAQGFPAHFITDVSRNGVQPTSQEAWGDWCNVINTGFGVRPTSDTGNALEDAFVWVKPGGECDGTSNSTSPRFDYHCALSDALQPAPEAGTWFQAYFAQLLTNANPSF
jgi:cellulose 1,4-beta-cellobiosidase